MNMLRASNQLILARLSGLCRVYSAATPRNYSEQPENDKDMKKSKTPIGRLDDKWEGKNEEMKPQKRSDSTDDAYGPFPNQTNPETGEIGGPRGPEPTRYGDWSYKGRAIDF